jgi:hypothetical protein
MNCTATRRNGSPCAAQALPGKPHCFAHDPSLAAKRQAAYTAGGRGKSNVSRAHKRLPADLKDVLAQLLTALDEVHRGDLDPRQATAMSSLAGSIARIYEGAELEARISALENKQ